MFIFPVVPSQTLDRLYLTLCSCKCWVFIHPVVPSQTLDRPYWCSLGVHCSFVLSAPHRHARQPRDGGSAVVRPELADWHQSGGARASGRRIDATAAAAAAAATAAAGPYDVHTAQGRASGVQQGGRHADADAKAAGSGDGKRQSV